MLTKYFFMVFTYINFPGMELPCKLGKDCAVFRLELDQGSFAISENHVTLPMLPETVCLRPAGGVMLHTGVST
jgi:hypothetical protein